MSEIRKIYENIFHKLQTYCDESNDEFIVVAEEINDGDMIYLDKRSESQDEVEKLKLKLHPSKILPQDKDELTKLHFVWSDALRAWVY